MAKGEQRGNREARKPKKEKQKMIAAALSAKGTTASTGESKRYNHEQLSSIVLGVPV